MRGSRGRGAGLGKGSQRRVWWTSTAAIAATLAIAACTEAVPPDLTTYTQMSHRFGVCMRPPEGAGYRLMSHGIDSDDGELVLAGAMIETQVTYNAPFAGDLPAGDGKAVNFRYMGMQRGQGQDRLLLGFKRDADSSPTYVVFTAPDLSGVEVTLRDPDFVVACQGVPSY